MGSDMGFDHISKLSYPPSFIHGTSAETVLQKTWKKSTWNDVTRYHSHGCSARLTS